MTEVVPFAALPEERLGQLLRRRRRELGLTQREVAVLGGISDENSVQTYEVGKIVPSLRSVKKLSVALAVPEQHLLSIREAKPAFNRNRPTPACGTTGGYDRHWRLKEPTCASCKEAHRMRSLQWARAHGATPRPPKAVCGSPQGADVHYASGEKPCPACYAARNQALREKGRANGRSELQKISMEDRRTIVWLREQNFSVSVIALVYGIDNGHCSRVSRGIL